MQGIGEALDIVMRKNESEYAEETPGDQLNASSRFRISCRFSGAFPD